MTTHDSRKNALPITRRRFAAGAGSAAAVAIMAAMSQDTPVAGAPVATTSASPSASSEASTAPTTVPTAGDFERVFWLERSLGRKLSPDMRQRVAEQIHQNEAAWSRGRQLPMPDGTEPAFVFAPEIHVAPVIDVAPGMDVAPVGTSTTPTTREADDER